MEIDRLEQIFEGPPLHGFNGDLGRSEGGDDDDGQAWINLTDLVERLQPRNVGQPDVEYDDVGRSRLTSATPCSPVWATDTSRVSERRLFSME